MNVIYDSDWCGLADDGAEPILCKCGFVVAKFVGFEGYNTGRRFLSCEGKVCDQMFVPFSLIFIVSSSFN